MCSSTRGVLQISTVGTYLVSFSTVANRWNEKSGLQRDALSSQCCVGVTLRLPSAEAIPHRSGIGHRRHVHDMTCSGVAPPACGTCCMTGSYLRTVNGQII